MSTLGRLERAAVQRRLARDCPPHVRLFWQRGDYSVPDRLVCGRCYAELERRPHAPEEPPTVDTGPAPLDVLRTFVARGQAAQRAVDQILAASPAAAPAITRGRRPRAGRRR
jgi:hypothetical protein